MKHFNSLLRQASLLVLLLLSAGAPAQSHTEKTCATADSVHISLLTCGPRQNVYSLYGHTAIRYEDRRNGIDVAVNYGMFSFGKPFFVLRFVFGLTDYEMGIERFEDFCSQYEPSGCGVWQQELNLTNAEKEAIGTAIAQNYEPENRVYRYNYFYDNCTTRARDILTKNINGDVRYTAAAANGPSFRRMIHACNENNRWARFGNDLLLGVKADKPTSVSEQQFLPRNLQKDFEKAVIVTPDGKTRPLVISEGWVLKPGSQAVESGFPLSPMQCACILATIISAATAAEYFKKRNFWGIDALLLTADGLCGLILLAMVFSQHPTVRINLQILLLNPLSAVFLWNTLKELRQRRISKWIYAWIACIILFITGGFFQSYAEGMYIMALSLLFRYTLKTAQLAKEKK